MTKQATLSTNLLEEAIKAHWGTRCAQPAGEPGCPICDAWAEFDALVGECAKEPSGLSLEQLTATNTAWYSSNDEEILHGGPYDTREEAEAEAEGSEHRLITQATKGPIRVSYYFDGDSFFEAAEECLYDMGNENGDPILDFTAEVNADLQTRVRIAIDEWQVAHQLSPMPWRFSSSDEPVIAAWVKDEDSEE